MYIGLALWVSCWISLNFRVFKLFPFLFESIYKSFHFSLNLKYTVRVYIPYSYLSPFLSEFPIYCWIFEYEYIQRAFLFSLNLSVFIHLSVSLWIYTYIFLSLYDSRYMYSSFKFLLNLYTVQLFPFLRVYCIGSLRLILTHRVDLEFSLSFWIF